MVPTQIRGRLVGTYNIDVRFTTSVTIGDCDLTLANYGVTLKDRDSNVASCNQLPFRFFRSLLPLRHNISFYNFFVSMQCGLRGRFLCPDPRLEYIRVNISNLFFKLSRRIHKVTLTHTMSKMATLLLRPINTNGPDTTAYYTAP